MFEKNEKIVSFNARPVTIFLAAGALVTFSSQSLCAMLLYDRSLILSGEIWRLFTCHLVHFSKVHLILDLICLAVAGWIIETRRYPGFGLMCIVSALTTSLASLLFLPDMVSYGGLSAIGVSSITYLCLFSLEENRSQRWAYRGMLILTAFKIVSEIIIKKPLFTSIENLPVFPVPLAHFSGVVAAALFFLKTKSKIRHINPTSTCSGSEACGITATELFVRT